MSLVAGIDYSTHAVDVVWLDEDGDRAQWFRCPLAGVDAFDRARSVHDAMRDTPGVAEGWLYTIAIGIEEPRGYNSGALYRVQGAILACLPRAVLVQPWLPQGWRKAVGLPGNASKDAVQVWAVNALLDAGMPGTTPVWPQDGYDAYCIALATRNALQKEAACDGSRDCPAASHIQGCFRDTSRGQKEDAA